MEEGEAQSNQQNEKYSNFDKEDSDYHPIIKKLKTEAVSNIFTVSIIVAIFVVLLVTIPLYFFFYQGEFSKEKIRGVNLGGWFILEPWITPSLFENQTTSNFVDEFTFCEQLGHSKAKIILEKHWNTWVTQKEIVKLSTYGINHVRIPVGHWMFDVDPSEPYVTGSLNYLKRSLKWMKESNIKVILDLHGAPGGQNGFDNSGRKDHREWACCIGKNTKRTIEILKNVTSIFSKSEYHSTIVGINLVNEPFGIDIQIVQDFYKNAIEAIQKVSDNPNLSITISDAFQKLDVWREFKKTIDEKSLFLDSHIYHVFDYSILNYTFDQHLKLTCNHKMEIEKSNMIIPTYIGEFSLARTDCTKWLNGYEKGSRYEGSLENTIPLGSCVFENDHNQWSVDYKNWMKIFFERQIDSYESGAGWFFWNFKTENSPHWDYLLGVKEGWIPKDFSTNTNKC
eukprot:gene6206-10212_t